MKLSMRSVAQRLRGFPLAGSMIERVAGRRQRRVTWSQFGEDAFLLGYYDRLRFEQGLDLADGLVVDVGGYRPIVHSNSYAFHRLGWRCINIDADPTSIQLFDAIRSDDVNVCAAVGPDHGTADFYVFGSPSVWNTLDPEKARSAQERNGVTPEIRSVNVRSLNSILEEHVGEEPLELLLIDAEGYDEIILRTCDLDRWQPRIVLLESHATSATALTSTSLIPEMSAKGYELVAWLNPNLVFARQDSVVGAGPTV